MFYFFTALAMVFNLTSPASLVQPVKVFKRFKPGCPPGMIRVSGGLEGGEPTPVTVLETGLPRPMSAIAHHEGKPE
jgi:hypothetical protein